MNLNRVVLTGNLTRDPELRTTGGGTSVCDLGVAVNEHEKKGDEWEDRPSFFTVTVWGKMAENCDKYLSKGSPVAIDGRLRQERWEKDGQPRHTVKIVAQAVQFLSSGEKKEEGSADAEQGDAPHGDDDDIPF